MRESFGEHLRDKGLDAHQLPKPRSLSSVLISILGSLGLGWVAYAARPGCTRYSVPPLLMMLLHRVQNDTSCSSMSMGMGCGTTQMLKAVGAQVCYVELPALPPVSVLLWIVCNSRYSSSALWTVVWFGNDDTRMFAHIFYRGLFPPRKHF